MVSNLWLDCFLRPPGFGGGGPGPDPGDDGGGVCTGTDCDPPDPCQDEIYYYCPPDSPMLNCSPKPFSWDVAGEGDEDLCNFVDSITVQGITYYKDWAKCIQNNPYCRWGPGGGGPGPPKPPPGPPGGTTDLTPCIAYVCDNPASGKCDGVSLMPNHPCYNVLFGDIIGCIPTGVANCGDGGRDFWSTLSKPLCDAMCKEDPDPGSTPGVCWKCPPATQGQMQKCCEPVDRIKTDKGWECPAGSTTLKKDCDDACLQGCWFCDDESQECEYKQVECGKSCIQLGGYKQWAQCSINCEGVKANCFECLVPGECCPQTCKRKKQGQGDCPSLCHEFQTDCDLACSHYCYECTGSVCTKTLKVDCGINCGDPGGGYANASCNNECDLNCFGCLNPGPTTCCEVDSTCTGSYCDNSQGCYDSGDLACESDCTYECPACDLEGTCNGTVFVNCGSPCPGCVEEDCEDNCKLTCYNCEYCGTGENECTGGGCIRVPGDFSCTDIGGNPVTCVFYGHLDDPDCDQTCPDCYQTCYMCNPDGDCTIQGNIACTTAGGSSQTCNDYNTMWYNDPACNNDCIKIDPNGYCAMECWACEEDGTFESCKSAGINFSCEGGEVCSDYSNEETVYYDNPSCDLQCLTGGDGESNYFQDDISTMSTAYAYDIVDHLYERNVNNRKYGLNNPPFQGVTRQTLPDRLFAPVVHASLEAVNILNNSDILFSDYPYTNLSNDHIENSLNKYIRQLINTTYLATGETIKSQVLRTIRQLLISNRINTIDSTVFIKYLEDIKKEQDSYPDTRGAGTSYTRGSHMSEAAAVRLASENNWPLEASDYEGTTVEKMKVWKTMATDLSKYLPITTSEGVTHKFYYTNSDEIALASTGTLSMSLGDVQQITDSAGGITEIPVLGNYSRARILDLEYLQRILYLLGENYTFTLNVTTDATLRVDERYGVDEAREDYYFLKLKPNTITSQQQNHSLVSVTKAKYTYLSSTSDISDWLEFRPWPYMTFYVDDTDPIFKYITNASGNGEVYLTTKDFTLNLFEGNENIPIYLRRVLQYIILIPTNLGNKVHNHQISTQKSYGERELTFAINPLPSTVASFDNSATMPHLQESFTYPSQGVSQRGTTKDSVSYEFDTETLVEVPKYLSGAPILPYPSYGMKQVLSALKEYKDDYYAPEGTVGWNEIYAKIDRGKMKYLYNETFNWSRTRSLLNLGKISTNEEVNSNYLKTRDIPSDDKKITDPTFDSASTRLIKKPDSSLPAPPGPV